MNKPGRIDAFFGTFFAAKTPAIVTYSGTVLLGLIAYLLHVLLFLLWGVWFAYSWLIAKLHSKGCVARRSLVAFKESRYVE